jgi:hypothetical protein
LRETAGLLRGAAEVLSKPADMLREVADMLRGLADVLSRAADLKFRSFIEKSLPNQKCRGRSCACPMSEAKNGLIKFNVEIY